MTEQSQEAGGTTQEQLRASAEEWKEIVLSIERQVRREAARVVGVEDDSDWAIIGRQAGDATRKGAAKGVGAREDASWDEIGGHVERAARSGLAGIFGASRDADWTDIGQTVDQTVRSFLQDLFGPKAQPTGQTESEEEEAEGPVDPWA